MRGRSRLDLTRERLARWRERHGGPGIPLPDELWAAAVEVARVEGVAATARALRLDRMRLEARSASASTGNGTTSEMAEAGDSFIELDASQLGLSSRTVVRLVGRDGERLEIELGGGATIDLAVLAEAFWRRPT